MKRLGLPVDVVWCFDVNLYADLRDGLVRPSEYSTLQIKLWRNFSAISRPPRASRYRVRGDTSECAQFRGAKFRNGHGLGAAFAVRAERRLSDCHYEPAKPLRVGYVGNLFIKYLDRNTIQKLVLGHSGC